MKKISTILLFISLAFISITSFGCSRVGPGEAGVKVYLLGGDKGVDHEVLGTGRHWIGWNEELHIFPTFQQNYVWTKDPTEGSPNDESITFQTNDGMSINTDVAIQYNITKDNVGQVFEKYRKGIDEITGIVLRNMVRDGFVSYSTAYDAEQAYSTNKNDLKDSVEAYTIKTAAESGITVTKLSYVGRMRLPNQIVNSINAKIQATQDAQKTENQVRQSIADAKKKIETARGDSISIVMKAHAEAEANRIVAKSLTSALVDYERVKKWDGKLSKVTGGAGVIMKMD